MIYPYILDSFLIYYYIAYYTESSQKSQDNNEAK